jgi:GT2 family glycosyltransferase
MHLKECIENSKSTLANCYMKIALTAAIYVTNEEHKKYLDLTTKSIVSKKHSVVWVPCENYVNPVLEPLTYTFKQEPNEIKVLHPTGQQSVSQAWNKGIEEGSKAGCNYILVINTDIIFKSNSIDRLVDFAETHPTAVLWTMTECRDSTNFENCAEDESFAEHPNFSCFMVQSDFFRHVGKFDENFIPAYCEDGDMHARIVLSGLKAYAYGGAKFFHFGSQTIKSDQELLGKNARTYPKCQLYFLEKWGHSMVNDVEQMRGAYFGHPYDEEDKPLSYWRQASSLGLVGKFRNSLPLSVRYQLVGGLNWIKRTKGRIKTRI